MGGWVNGDKTYLELVDLGGEVRLELFKALAVVGLGGTLAGLDG